MDKSLEAITQKKEQIKPVVEEILSEGLGVTIKEVVDDISGILAEGDLAIDVDLNKPLKGAKKDFKLSYSRKLLGQTAGNISEASRQAKIDRRTLHRYVEDQSSLLESIRGKELEFAFDRKQKQILDIVGRTLDKYELVGFQDKIHEDTVKSLAHCLPAYLPPLDVAVRLFEKRYIETAFSQWGPRIKDVAQKIGLRPETLGQKCKELGIGKQLETSDSLKHLYLNQRKKAELKIEENEQ